MRVFISHSFSDHEKFDDVKRVLSDAGIDCFRLDEMLVGRGLSEQLRDELEACNACIFIATRNSIKSDWCNAELGPAWGLRKLVAIYLADSELYPKDLPDQFRGHLRQRSMFALAESVKRQLKDFESQTGEDELPAKGAALTVDLEEFREVLRTELRRERAHTWIHELLVDLRSELAREDWSTRTNKIRRLLTGFLGQPHINIPRPQTAGWPYEFSADTSTGTWDGFALDQLTTAHGDLDIYKNCVLLHRDENREIDSAAVVSNVREESHPGMLGLSPWTNDSKVIVVGTTELGEAACSRR